MTEILTEPQAPPEESTPAVPGPVVPVTARQVEHTPGGFPVVPLSLSGTNATAGLLATTALAGGPVAAVIAATGAAMLGAVAARQRAKTKTSKPTGSKTPAGKAPSGSSRTPAGAAGRGLLGRVPSQSRTGKTPGTTGGSGAGARKTAGGQARHSAGAPGGGRTGSAAGKAGSLSPRQRAARAAAGLTGGRAGQVQALRSQARTQSPTRAAARTANAQARRQVADNRRATKAAERSAPAGGKPRGVAARTLAKGLGKAAAVRDKTAGTLRAACDRQAARAVAGGREQVRQAARRALLAAAKAPAQKAARKALLRSAARFHARRALAAALGGALGLLGLVTTPLGRKLGWGWLMNPGRRLYRWLVGRARAERETRDADIAAQLAADEQAAEDLVDAEQDADEQQIGDRAERPTAHVPAPPTPEGAHAVSNVSGFRFEELAAEMEQAAQSYEPENCMEILAMLEGLPEALQAIANILRILAERSDTEFPLEKVVADMLSDLFQVFTNSVGFSEELGPTFRQAHEADIARHEDPRNGYEAEKGWNV
ncbi:hypothetical protein ABT143_36415 [Streptomyces sp. NPDC002033]|uniref:hypothetical protein n=1 Tax=unclassified Streptomyces TaxID=2593676 RepID=UPI00332114FC